MGSEGGRQAEATFKSPSSIRFLPLFLSSFVDGVYPANIAAPLDYAISNITSSLPQQVADRKLQSLA